MILTVIEVKGLEFEDVILWNFFSYDHESNLKEIWEVLNTLEILYEEMDCLFTKKEDNITETLLKFDGINDRNIDRNTMKVRCAKKTNETSSF